MQLVKGSGPRSLDERSVPTLRRGTPAARALGRWTRLEPFVIEHLSFALSLQPLLLRRRPDVVYFSEWHVGRALAALRLASRSRFKLVICNGSSSPGPYDHLDRVQHLTPGALRWVLERGADPGKNVVLQLGVRMNRQFTPLSAEERRALRRDLHLPVDAQVVVSVAALNRQKRIDYLIEEIAAMPEPRPFLLLVGAVEDETAPLRELADAMLGTAGYSMRSVPRSEVDDLTKASDVFVLASTFEGLPRALIEAMGQGLLCVAHSYPVMEYALGGQGRIADLEEPGALGKLLTRIDPSELTAARAAARHSSAYERFSWDSLRPAYVKLLTDALN